ncbi:hypothetical protein Tco_1267981 [Tanacetum coccineum]
MQEASQCAGSDTRPPMLDRTDFESWQQRIRLYCLGKDNGENIMKSIKEGPFQMGTVSDVITGGTGGCSSQGPGKREDDCWKSKLTKRPGNLSYRVFEHFRTNQRRNIQVILR